MSAEERKSCGNTLLALASNKKLPSGILATTLCEDKKELKERLIQIMKFKKKPVWAIVPALALTLALAGCAATLGAATSSSGNKISESGILTDATAYSRKMDGTVFNWHNNGCSYELEESGMVLLSYENGAATAKAPVVLSANADNDGPNIDNTGLFISDEKTAIAYNNANSCGPITVITSGDQGQTWETASIDFDSYLSWIKIGFTTEEQGWLVACSGPAMGAEKHAIYTTSDGGKIWTVVESNIDEVYGRMLSGAAFINEKTGFLCFRYETDFQPAVCMTQDGGLTWSKVAITLPDEYEQYNQTPLSPVYDGTTITMPILLSSDDTNLTIYLTSKDEGITWTYDEPIGNDFSGFFVFSYICH